MRGPPPPVSTSYYIPQQHQGHPQQRQFEFALAVSLAPPSPPIAVMGACCNECYELGEACDQYTQDASDALTMVDGASMG